MRIAVYYPAGHPAVGVYPEGHPQAGQPAEPTAFAYRLGRIEDGVHNHVLHTGETIPLQEFVGGLVAQAKAEHPDAQVVVERLVDNGDETSRWIAADQLSAEHTPAPPGGAAAAATEISVSSEQAAG